MRSLGFFVLLVAGSIVASACASKHVAPLVSPVRVDAFCAKKEPRLSALLSVMTSTSDTIVSGDALTDASVRALARRSGGVIGYWNDQLLSLPKTARALGESDDYARVRAAAVLAPPDGVTNRRLYLKVRAREADRSQESARWIILDAFDVQNPCVEGHRAM
jgi:hypothetical protein